MSILNKNDRNLPIRQKTARTSVRASLLPVCLALLCLLLFRCGRAQAGSFTLMVYMTGSDLESKGGAASADLYEMMDAVPEDGDVRIVALVSGSKKWEAPVDPEHTSVYEIRRGEMTCVREGPLRSMGDPDTLADFLAWSAEAYPADRYGLILWDHGGGPLLGVCFDELFYRQNDERDCLTLPELSAALGAGPFSSEKLTFIGFDACLMGSIEVAAAVRPFAEYMIASQEPVPPAGWDYCFVSALADAEDGAAVGQQVIDAYARSLADTEKAVTLSCLDLSRCEAVLQAMDTFFSALEPQVTEETYIDYAECRMLSKALGLKTTTQYDLVDLIDLVSLYGESGLADGSELVGLIREMITVQFAKKDEYVNGVSVYNPFDNKSGYLSPWGALYPELAPAEGYRSFVSSMAALSMGKTLMEWNSEYQTGLQETEGTVRISVALTEEEIRNTGRTRMFVLEKKSSGGYQMIWYDNGCVEKTADSLEAVYRGNALYEVDADGNILNGPLTFFPADNGFVLYGILSFAVDFSQPLDSSDMMSVVKLLYQYDESGQPVFSEVLTENEGVYLPAAIRLEDCLELQIFNAGPRLSEDGKMTLGFELLNPLSLWISEGAPRLAVLPVQNRNDRYACLAWTDYQDQSVFSDLVSVPNPTAYSVVFEPAEAQDARISAAVDSVEIMTGYDAGIHCVLKAESRTEQEFLLAVTEVSVNGIPMSNLSGEIHLVGPGKTEEISVFVESGRIRQQGLSEVNEIRMVLRARYADGEQQVYTLEVPVWINSSIFLQE